MSDVTSPDVASSQEIESTEIKRDFRVLADEVLDIADNLIEDYKLNSDSGVHLPTVAWMFHGNSSELRKILDQVLKGELSSKEQPVIVLPFGPFGGPVDLIGKDKFGEGFDFSNNLSEYFLNKLGYLKDGEHIEGDRGYIRGNRGRGMITVSDAGFMGRLVIDQPDKPFLAWCSFDGRTSDDKASLQNITLVHKTHPLFGEGRIKGL